MMFVCAHCEALAKLQTDVLDSGTTLVCVACGGETIVLLLTVHDYMRWCAKKEGEQ